MIPVVASCAALGLALLPTIAGAADLGTLGPTYGIAEPHLLNFIEQRLRDKERSGELQRLMQEAQSRGIDAVKRPQPVAGLRATEGPRTFYVDPTFTLDRNLVDAQGRLLVQSAGFTSPPRDNVNCSNLSDASTAVHSSTRATRRGAALRDLRDVSGWPHVAATDLIRHIAIKDVRTDRGGAFAVARPPRADGARVIEECAVGWIDGRARKHFARDLLRLHPRHLIGAAARIALGVLHQRPVRIAEIPRRELLRREHDGFEIIAEAIADAVDDDVRNRAHAIGAFRTRFAPCGRGEEMHFIFVHRAQSQRGSCCRFLRNEAGDDGLTANHSGQRVRIKCKVHGGGHDENA